MYYIYAYIYMHAYISNTQKNRVKIRIAEKRNLGRYCRKKDIVEIIMIISSNLVTRGM